MHCLGITKKIAIVSGFGESDKSEINAFDNALISAKIHDCNLIKVSSILAKETEIVKEFEIEKGSFVPCVLSSSKTKKGENTSSGVGIAFNNEGYGYVMEAQGETKQEVKEKLEKRIQEMAENRNQQTTKTQLEIKESKTNKKYGCTLTAVIYLF